MYPQLNDMGIELALESCNNNEVRSIEVSEYFVVVVIQKVPRRRRLFEPRY